MGTGTDVYVALSAEGTVRGSGVGAPPWSKWVIDLPQMDDPRTKVLG